MKIEDKLTYQSRVDLVNRCTLIRGVEGCTLGNALNNVVRWYCFDVKQGTSMTINEGIDELMDTLRSMKK